MAHSFLRRSITASLVLLLLVGLFFDTRGGVQTAHAATLTVNTLEDDVGFFDTRCTLRRAISLITTDIANACGVAALLIGGPVTISFSVSGEITLDSPLPVLSGEVIIDGSGITINGAGHSVFEVAFTSWYIPWGHLTLSNMAIENGSPAISVDYLSSLTVTNSIFFHNSPAIDNASLQPVFVTDSRFLANEGAIEQNMWGTMTVADTEFHYNHDESGGALDLSIGSTVNVNDSWFADNSADYGGAIYNGGGTLTVTNSGFVDNSARQGGAIYHGAWGTLLVEVSTFAGNSADDGGAIYDIGSFYDDDDSLGSGAARVVNSTFARNSATYGGAIYSASGMKVTNSTFSDNHATYGGAIRSTYNLHVIGSTFAYNSATYGGSISSTAWRRVHLAGNLFQRGSEGSNCHGVEWTADSGYNLSSDDSCTWTWAPGSQANVPLNLSGLSSGPGLQVHTPLAGSAALGAIPPGTQVFTSQLRWTCDGSTTDQIGSSRPLVSGGRCTAGAVEVQSPPPSIHVTPAEPLSLSESGPGSQSFTFTLGLVPFGEVTVPLSVSSPQCRITTGGAAILLNKANWRQGYAVTITAVDDAIRDGHVRCDLVTGDPASPGDTAYDALLAADSPDVNITIIDNDWAGVYIIHSDRVITSESGTTDTFEVVLRSEPTDDVTVGLSVLNTSEGALDRDTLTFTSADWDSAQTVTVTGLDDDVVDGDISYIVTATTSSLDGNYLGAIAGLDIINTDDDTAAVFINPDSVTTDESGTTATFEVVLGSEPTNDVTVDLSGVNTSEGALDRDTLTFTSADWDSAQTVTVTGLDDDVVDGDISYIVTATTSSLDGNYLGAIAGLEIINADDDTATLFINPISATTDESGTTAAFEVALGSQPTADVTVDLSGGNSSEGALDRDALTFTSADWDSAQTVTVTGLDDDVVDGDITYTVAASTSSNDPNYVGLTGSIEVTNADDDTAALFINPISATTDESGTTAAFEVVLGSQPTADVTVSLSGVIASEGTLDRDTLTFTSADWDSAQTVTITGQDDALVDGAITYTITATTSGGDPNYTSLTGSIEVTNTDDDMLPTLTSLVPSEAIAGNDAFVLTLNGAYFMQSSIVHWNGVSRPAIYVSSTQLTVEIASTDISVEGTANVTVVSPGPMGGASNALPFTILPANQPPTVHADGPYSVNEGDTVVVTASGYDPNGDPLTYAWDLNNDHVFETAGQSATFSAVNLSGPSSHPITVQVMDDGSLSVTAQAVVDVLNVPPTANAGPDLTVLRNDPVNVSGTWTDPAASADDLYAWVWNLSSSSSSGSASYGSIANASTAFGLEGQYTLAFQVSDKDGGSSSDTLLVTVQNRPPDCSAVTPSLNSLWPPQHQMVQVAVQGASDPEGDPVALTITSIFQDEPTNGQGDGDTSPDAEGIGTSVATLRAERAGVGNGRMYYINYSVNDGHGGACTGTVRVGVNHNPGNQGEAVDDGLQYDSTQP